MVGNGQKYRTLVCRFQKKNIHRSYHFQFSLTLSGVHHQRSHLKTLGIPGTP